ncbi:MAG: M23 family metallopeptidase [Acidobacteriota bacterium]
MKSPSISNRWPKLVGALILGLAAAMSWFRVGPPPTVSIVPELPGIGRATPVTVQVAAGQRGLSTVTAELVQGDRVERLAERAHVPRPFWAFWGPRVTEDELAFEVGSDTVAGLAEGEAAIRITAERASTWLRSPAPVVEQLMLPVRLEPPSIQVTSSQTYVAQGGSEAVVYKVGASAVRDGVRVAGHWFPGYPLPGSETGERFALFGVPQDLGDATGIRLVAVDDVGNEAAVRFVDRFISKPLRTDTINLSDRFMQRVVPAIFERTSQVEDQGDLLASYLAINRDLRRLNAEALNELASESAPEFLWSQPFIQLPNAQSMASFADRRTYVYKGQEVDQQDHLGFDLASVRQAPVLSANRGRVVLAEYFGIYGNTVVVDHGYGLMTLYAHLSSIEAEKGQDVERGESLGRTGETGLAGGDHLHFSILLHGMQVNPLEWWDRRWISHRLGRKLGPALPMQES